MPAVNRRINGGFITRGKRRSFATITVEERPKKAHHGNGRIMHFLAILQRKPLINASRPKDLGLLY
jgi:hypothetical protein